MAEVSIEGSLDPENITYKEVAELFPDTHIHKLDGGFNILFVTKYETPKN